MLQGVYTFEVTSILCSAISQVLQKIENNFFVLSKTESQVIWQDAELLRGTKETTLSYSCDVHEWKEKLLLLSEWVKSTLPNVMIACETNFHAQANWKSSGRVSKALINSKMVISGTVGLWFIKCYRSRFWYRSCISMVSDDEGVNVSH